MQCSGSSRGSKCLVRLSKSFDMKFLDLRKQSTKVGFGIHRGWRRYPSLSLYQNMLLTYDFVSIEFVAFAFDKFPQCPHLKTEWAELRRHRLVRHLQFLAQDADERRYSCKAYKFVE